MHHIRSKMTAERKQILSILSKSQEVNFSDTVAIHFQNQIFGFSADTEHDFDPRVVHELTLQIWASGKPLVAKYLGKHLPSVHSAIELKTPQSIHENQLITFDIIGGKRSYCWRFLTPSGLDSALESNPKFEKLIEWFNDPEARIVLSISSGGVRCYGVPTALRMLDQLGVRHNIDELWGTSGGAIAAYLYGIGVPPSKQEEIAYRIYNEHYPDLPMFKNKSGFLRRVAKGIWGFRAKATTGIFQFYAPMLDIIKDAEAWKDPSLRNIPFYAVATDLHRKGPVALSSSYDIPAHLQTMMYHCSPRKACVASASVPLVFPLQKIKSRDGTNLLCCDGAISEELPLMMPFVKWYRDNLSNLKERKKRKLKIFYLDFAQHFPEAPIPTETSSFRITSYSFGNIATRVLDILLCRPKLNFMTLSQDMKDVEVMGIRVDLEKISLLDASKIPQIIDSTRAIFHERLLKLEKKLQLGEANDKIPLNFEQRSG